MSGKVRKKWSGNKNIYGSSPSMLLNILSAEKNRTIHWWAGFDQ